MKALDLFCCAGGASMGLHRAGFEVVGVDVENHAKRYPFKFVQADALTYPLDGFDLIWASPPCQSHSMFSKNLGTAKNFTDVIAPIRERLVASGVPYIIENVPGAPLLSPVVLCGSMFGLGVRRHRLFETSFRVDQPTHPRHEGLAVPVYGRTTPKWYFERLGRSITGAERNAAMGIDWMNRDQLSQAVPPAYSEWLARRFLETREAA